MLSVCKPGSIAQKSFTGIVGFIILDILLIITIFWNRKLFKQERRNARKLPKTSTSNDRLLDNFKKSMNGKKMQMHFKLEGIFYHLSDGKMIIQDLSGMIHASRMTAILGPSGAGSRFF